MTELGHRYDYKVGKKYKVGTKMIELHVDTFLSLVRDFGLKEDEQCAKFIDDQYGKDFGGNPSVRKDPNKKMLISFWHDEAIFRKNVFGSRGWAGARGETKCFPKEDGVGVMVSALQSREFGWGFPPLSEEELKKVNDFRGEIEHREYLDKDAAIFVKKK